MKDLSFRTSGPWLWASAIQICVLCFASQNLFAAVGRTLSVTGQPTLTTRSSEVKILGPGFPLNPYEDIATDDQSTAKLHFIDETILDVSAGSSFRIPNIVAPDSPQRKVQIEVTKGRIRANVNREIERAKGLFEVHTKAAILGVEGTDFVIDVPPVAEDGTTTTTITVLEGQVAVRSGRELNNPAARHITLTKGMTFTATAKLIGETIQQDEFDEKLIQKLDSASLNDVASKAQLTNKTFIHAVSLSGKAAGFGASTLQTMGASIGADPIKAIKKASGDGKQDIFSTRFQQTPDNGVAPSAHVKITTQ